ncbi:MAG TPA: glycerol kinase GlpK [Chloroflexota bacterium]|nr:glycerol kinase GlpK [Chloroflexota bacterium]
MNASVLAIDQGTTRTKALIVDQAAHCLHLSSIEVPLRYPQPGWVEQDGEQILAGVVESARRALDDAGDTVMALGLANQGETVVIWDRRTGHALGPAISWQDRRTEALCAELRATGHGTTITARTGLPLDPYFSATKLRWLLDHVPEARALARHGNLLAGTTDAWLLWHLTGEHRTDHATASRTMLYDPRTGAWDDVVLDLLRIPRAILPAISPTCADYGRARAALLGRDLPVSASIVDQQAALFGQGCHTPGDVKITYGTGAFLLANTGRRLVSSRHGLVPTVAWALDGAHTYALDGGIYVAGAAVQWLRDGLGILQDPAASATLATSVPDSGGVVFVPALTGLAAPYWDSATRGTLFGLTRGSTGAHIARATLEGIAMLTRDVLEAMTQDMGQPISTIKADGGAAANPFLMQTLADLAEVEVRVAAQPEATALGVAFLAGLGVGLWREPAETAALWREATRYQPRPRADLAQVRARWQRAVALARGWADSG